VVVRGGTRPPVCILAGVRARAIAAVCCPEAAFCRLFRAFCSVLLNSVVVAEFLSFKSFVDNQSAHTNTFFEKKSGVAEQPIL